MHEILLWLVDSVYIADDEPTSSDKKDDACSGVAEAQCNLHSQHRRFPALSRVVYTVSFTPKYIWKSVFAFNDVNIHSQRQTYNIRRDSENYRGV